MKSTEIVDLYDETYYLGGISKYNGQEIGVEGWQEFNKGGISYAKRMLVTSVNIVDKHVLDVGFGRGEILKYCIEHGAKSCVGIDYSPAAMKIASKHINNPAVMLYNSAVTDIDKLPESGFDVVFLIDILEHVSTEEWKEFFEKLVPKLNAGCELVINTPAYPMGDYLNMHNNYFNETQLHDLLDSHFNINIIKHGKYIIKCKLKSITAKA